MTVLSDGAEEHSERPQANALLEMYGAAEGPASCALLTPAIQARLRGMAAGQVLEVRVDDPTARDDIASWCRLTRNELLAVVSEESVTHYYLRKRQGWIEKGDFPMSKILVHCTHGKDDPERATLAFIVANVAASADQEAVLLLTIDGVWMATKGYADGVNKEGFPPVKDVIKSFIDNGGQIWACGTCAKPRGITEADLIEGARIVTAANVVEEIACGAATLDF